MKEKLEELLVYLSESHHPQNIENTSDNLGIEINDLRNMIDFLVKYDFIQYDSKQLKIDPEIREIYPYNQTNSKNTVH